MITVTGAKVNLTEQTVRELLSAIEKAKEITTFTDEPMPEGDMVPADHTHHKRERGEISVKSPHTGIHFAVSLETKPHTQESMGYRLDPGVNSRIVRIGKDGRCMCSQADKCPLGKAGMSLRCTKEELEAQGVQVIVDKITQFPAEPKEL